MVLRGLQTLLGRLYDVDLPYDVYDFLVTDRRAVGESTNERRALDEELLLAETADGAGVALYLDPEILSRLEAADPHQALTENNLADYCTALEGVSHFVYSTWGLERRFVNRGRLKIEAMVRELRSFYRLRHAAKLRHALA